MSSNAVGTERISRVVGYKVTKGNFSNTTRNLPQRIAILGEANHANQATFPTDPKQVTSAQQAGQLYGYGSPIHQMVCILRPSSGGMVGGIPTVVYPQAAAGGAAYRILTLTVTGTATANGTHTLVIAGRRGKGGVNYDINIESGDTSTAIAAKIEDAVNAVLGSPVTASNVASPPSPDVVLTSKWKGLTANDITVTVDTNDLSLGVTYAVVSTQAGSGTPSVQPALDSFGNEWNTLVINPYGTVTSVLDALEAYNGIPDPELPTGRYDGLIMRPFIALTGSTAADPSSITDSRKDNVTIAICPAPLSSGLPMEAAANMCALFSRTMQDTPHLDVSGKSYPDMPVPDDSVIGAMSEYENRDAIVKKGCSTVDLHNGRYQVQDFVTTYHPQGEEPPQFRYSRNIMVDLNVKYGYYLLQDLYVRDHAIANDADIVTVEKVVKPKTWKGVVNTYAEALAKRNLIVDAPFMQDSIEVNVGTSNPDRLETFFRYKRSGYVRIAPTTAEAGFNFGNV